MQTEAGESLEGIIARKEAERAAGNGEFWWGIGNSLGKAVQDAAKVDGGLPVLFSVMLTRPKKIDTSPGEVYLWTGYEDPDGGIHDLPPHVIVTSRGGASKSRHYALVCQSAVPLAKGDHGPFDRHRCLTLNGKVPAGSQVTALLQSDLDAGHAGGQYRIAFRARLVPPWVAKLVRHRALRSIEKTQLATCAGEDWWNIASELRSV
jgi:hypothetical protein